MLSKLNAHRAVAVFIFCAILLCIFLIFALWPRKCSSPIQSESELTFYFVTPIFSDESSSPKLISELRTINSDSVEYGEVVDIMNTFSYHLSPFPISKDNRVLWLIVYDADGNIILECRGTNDIEIRGTTYSIYGEQSNGLTMLQAIYSILIN